jgi:DTW domain-containing protein YfiP
VATRLVIVQHVRERLKPTNTGRLLQRMVPDVVLVHFGMREPAFDETPFDDPFVDFRVLYPRDDAAVLGPGAGGQRDPGRRLGFVVLDGTWHQCSRMSRRVPRVRDFECVALPPGRRSIWTVRTQHDPRGMSTFEAAIRLIEAVEGPEVIAPLQHAFEIVTARALFMKGKLSSPDVPDPWPVV